MGAGESRAMAAGGFGKLGALMGYHSMTINILKIISVFI